MGVYIFLSKRVTYKIDFYSIFYIDLFCMNVCNKYVWVCMLWCAHGGQKNICGSWFSVPCEFQGSNLDPQTWEQVWLDELFHQPYFLNIFKSNAEPSGCFWSLDTLKNYRSTTSLAKSLHTVPDTKASKESGKFRAQPSKTTAG